MSNQEPTDTNAKALWKKVLGELQVELSEFVYKTWVSRATAEHLTENSIQIVSPSKHIKDQLAGKYFPIIKESIDRLGKGSFNITFIIKEEEKDASAPGPLFEEEPKQKEVEVITEKDIVRAGMSPKYTFDNYIMGTNNQVAFAIANAVANSPGTVYNPFFLYSGVGLGKTHLMQATGNKILRQNPGLKVIYCTGESFTNELIENLQKGKRNGKYTSNEFRDKFRKADILLIDDIQFIAGKEATQEEFFHTFDALLRTQKQIIITSDRPPKDFNNIEDRIKSRFGSGIIADIQPPDVEMRNAILRKRRDAKGDPVTNEVINFIAERVSSNVRELEGAYMQVIASCQTQGMEISVQNAARVLGQTVAEAPTKPLNVNQILKAVCNYYSVKASDVKGKRRTKDRVVPRQVTMYLIKEMTGTPLMTIGEFLGGRDHTTIIHGVGKVENEIHEMGKIRQDVLNVKQMIQIETMSYRK